MPAYEVLGNNGIGGAVIIYNVAAFLGVYIARQAYVAVTSLYVNSTVNIGNAAIEAGGIRGGGRVQLREVICQEAVGAHLHVVGYLAEMVMVQAAEDVSGIAVLVVQRDSVELKVVYSQDYGVAGHSVPASVGLYGECSVGNHSTRKVQRAERSVEFHLAIAL